MKKILYNVVLATLIISNCIAELNQNQIDAYMQNSRSGSLLKYLQDDMFYWIVRMYKIDLNSASKEMIHRIKKELNTPKYVKKYTDKFKTIDTSGYETMMLFYNTPTGKKYAKVMEKDFKLDQNSSRAALVANYQKFLAKHPFGEEKKALIRQIMETLNTVDIAIKTTEAFEIFKKNTLPLKFKILNFKSKEAIKKEIKESYSHMRALQTQTDMIYFKDFSEEELEEVLEYTKTNIAKAEYRLMAEAGNAYYRGVMNDIMEDLYDKNTSQQCD